VRDRIAVGLAAAILAVLLPAAAWPQEKLSTIGLRLLPSLEVPVGTSAGYYGLGGSAALLAEYKPPIAFPLVMTAGLGYGLQPLDAFGLNLNVFSASAGIGVQVPFLTRLSLGVFARGGYFIGLVRDEIGNPTWGGNPFAAADGGLDFYVTPSLSLGIAAGYRHFFGPATPLLSSVSVSLGTHYRFPISGSVGFGPAPARPSPLEIRDVATDVILPVFYQYYDSHPIGRAVLVNKGRQPARDLRVSVFIRSYMDSPKTVEVQGEVPAGGSREIDLYALFTEKVLEITEGTKVAAEIGLSFTAGKEPWTSSSVQTVRLENRNASTWDDNRRAAAFVTARDPAVLTYAKAVASLVRSGENQVLDYALRTAIAMHGALGLSGIGYVPDPKTPYVQYVKNATAIDFLQFPRQTLTYKSGDCDDLTVLYAALLAAASVDTALVTVPEHIFLAFALDLPPESAARFLGSTDGLIVRDGRTWMPLEVTLVRESFLAAWQEGAREWKQYAGGKEAGFYPLADAWKTFEPVGLPGEATASPPPDAKIMETYKAEIGRLADLVLGPRVKELEARITQAKDTQRLYNSLGLLYARFGILDKAEAQFLKSAAIRSYAPALLNLGNVHLLRKAPDKALRYYQQAQRQDPGNPNVLAGLAQSYAALNMKADADRALTQLANVSPDTAKRLQGGGAAQAGDAVRAGDAAGKEMVTWEE
jgi:tetratricopeptide (TPR) repeat protein